jgi:hypothetical protein
MIRLRTQTCMDSKVVRAVFWQRTDLPPGSNMLRLAYADSGSACKLAGVQIIPLPTLANQILARTFFRSVAHLFACPAVGKFSRASSAGGRLNLRSNIEQPDRVGRRGLSEPREDFSRLNTYAFPWLCLFPSRIRLRIQPLESSLGRVPHAAWRRMFTVKRAENIVIPNTNHATACSRRNRMMDCESISWCFLSAIFTGTLPS